MGGGWRAGPARGRAARPTRPLPPAAQAVVAWSLAAAFSGAPLPLVAEEDAATLRTPAGAGMAARVAALVNHAIGAASPGSPPLSVAAVLDLIDTGDSLGGAAGMHWVLDPIDGTKGFVGGRQYAVCLGLLDGGAAVLGVLGCPNLPASTRLAAIDGEAGPAGKKRGDVGVLFWAAAGAGSFAEPLHNDQAASPAARLGVGDPPPGTPGVRFMESYEARHSDFELAAGLARALGVASPALRLDSQAKYGALARGDAAINLRFPPSAYREKIWDHVAGAVVAAEAGAVVSDAGGAPLDFSRGRWLDLDRGIVTAPPALHAALLAALKEEEVEEKAA